MPSWSPLVAECDRPDFFAIQKSIATEVFNHYSVNNGIDLLRGRLGPLLMLSHSNEEDYQVAYKIESLLSEISRSSNINGSFMLGLAGLGYVLNIIGKKDKNSTYQELLEDFYPFIKKFAIQSVREGNFDFMYGYLGQGYFLLGEHKNEETFEIFKAILKDLEKQSIVQEKGVGWINPWEESIVLASSSSMQKPAVANLGMSHGLPGIIYILSLIDKKYPELGASSLISQALECLISEESEENRADAGFYYPIYSGELRKTRRGQLSWCYSDLGISIMYLNLWQITNNEDYLCRAKKIALSCSIYRLEQIPSMCSGLCHGASGVAHMFNKLYQVTGIKDFKAASLYWYSVLLDNFLHIDKDGSVKLITFDKKTRQKIISKDYGFLEGISGVGLSLLSATSSEELEWDRILLM